MKKVKLTFFFLLIFFLFAGCSQQRYSVVVSENGTVSFSFKVSVDKETYSFLDAYHIREPENTEDEQKEDFDASAFEEAREDEEGDKKDSPKREEKKVDPFFEEYAKFYESRGFNVTPVSDATEEGIEIRKDYSSYQEFNEEIKAMYENKEIGINLFTGKKKSFYKEEYRIFGEMIFLTDSDFEEMKQAMIDVGSAIEPSRMKATIQIRLPGEVTYINGTPERGNFVWEVRLSDEKPADIKYATQIVNKQIIFFALLGAGVLGIFVLLIVLIRLRKKLRRRKFAHLYDDEDDY